MSDMSEKFSLQVVVLDACILSVQAASILAYAVFICHTLYFLSRVFTYSVEQNTHLL